MSQLARITLSGLVALFLVMAPAGAQERVQPQAARGGEPQGTAWAEVPESFRGLKLPEWPLPDNLERWQNTGRSETRATLLRLLGDMPPRPDPAKVRVVSKEDLGTHTVERIEFHNGVDMIVTGMLLVPKKRASPAPAIVVMHGHNTGKDNVCINPQHSECVGPLLVENGYVVAAIDAYFDGDRRGRGPGGKLDATARGQEESQFKLHLWQGRTLWGMMLRDEQCLIDYLCTRPDVRKDCIGGTGMSMGCTRSWWLAAIDDRVQAIVGVACFTRYADLIAHGNLRKHGIYYFVPGLLAHFDTEAIYSLVAPRPMLMLSGDQDGGAPTEGVETLERKLSQVYRLYGQPGSFRSVLYKNTGHEYLPEMRTEMLHWFQRHLPVDPGGSR